MDPNDQLPERLQRELQRLGAALPSRLDQRERQMLQRAHGLMRRGRARYWWAGAAAAALMLSLGLWQMRPQPEALVHQSPSSPAVATAQQPTIVDALHLAKRLQARAEQLRQADVDRVAYAAVSLASGELR